MLALEHIPEHMLEHMLAEAGHMLEHMPMLEDVGHSSLNCLESTSIARRGMGRAGEQALTGTIFSFLDAPQSRSEARGRVCVES